MKNVLIIGVGGTGSHAVDLLYQKIASLREKLGENDANIVSVVFDTDAGDLAKITNATTIDMTAEGTAGTVCDHLGWDYVKEWFPYDVASIRQLRMDQGAGQWRKKSYLAFMNLMADPAKRNQFHQALEKMRNTYGTASYEIYVVSSVAGGTGSGSFIPITLYAKKYLRETLGAKGITATAMVACPDIYAPKQVDANMRTKIYANAYAIFRELNAMSQVCNGSNNPDPSQRKTEGVPPVHFTIGSEDNPHVGLLFDSDNKDFWTPEAAPFSRIFLLDRIPSLDSVEAHDSVLVDSLYSIICTQVGPTIGTEMDNHMILLTQNDGHNGIYSGIGTSEVIFPLADVIDYIAHRKTLEDSAGEWMLLHEATEDKIAADMEAYRARRITYTMKDGEYAEKWLASAEAECRTPTSTVPDIIRRCTKEAYQEGDDIKERDIFSEYWASLEAQLEAYIPGIKKVKESINSVERPLKGKLFSSGEFKKAQKTKALEAVDACYSILNKYYKSCVEKIIGNLDTVSNAVLPLDVKKDYKAGGQLSFVLNVLMRKDMFIHPIGTMKQLCEFKLALRKFLKDNTVNPWADIVSRDPNPRVKISSFGQVIGNSKQSAADARHSAYIQAGPSRFDAFVADEKKREAYGEANTDPMVDGEAIIADAVYYADQIYKDAVTQLKVMVLKTVSERVDEIIKQYRSFFTRFDEERARLEIQTENAKKRHAGVDGSKIYLTSTPADKEAAYEDYKSMAGVASDEDVRMADHQVGDSAFAVVYDIAARTTDKKADVADMKGIAAIFKSMVQANAEQVRRSNYYTEFIGKKSVLEIVADSDKNKPEAAVRTMLSTAMELAKPGLLAENLTDSDHKTNDLYVFLISTNTARYLLRNYAAFGLATPHEGSEAAMLREISNSFVGRFSVQGARIAVVNDIPDTMMSVTREVVDVRPTNIRKMDECSSNAIYYKEYVKAIEKMGDKDSDMWNPHLSFDLHRRGYLPYINLKKEEEEDTKLMKALLYAIMKKQFSFRSPLRQEKGFRCSIDGREMLLKDETGRVIDEKNLCSLIGWLRPKDDLIEAWSTEFDRKVRDQLEKLRPAYSDNDKGKTETDITNAEFVRKMRENLFEEIIAESSYSAENTASKQLSLSLFELYNKVKRTEESAGKFDCNDAEKLLRVGYETFVAFCEAGASSTTTPEIYTSIYTQQIEKFMIALLCDEDIQRDGDPEFRAESLKNMVNDAGYFKMISHIDEEKPKEKWEYARFEYTDAIKSKAKSIIKPKSDETTDTDGDPVGAGADGGEGDTAN